MKLVTRVICSPPSTLLIVRYVGCSDISSEVAIVANQEAVRIPSKGVTLYKKADGKKLKNPSSVCKAFKDFSFIVMSL